MKKRLISFILILSIILLSSATIYAHDIVLEIGYDPCGVRLEDKGTHKQTIYEDGENEWWYELTFGSYTQRHIGNEVTTRCNGYG